MNAQVTLKAFMVEFRDHELVKTRKSADGADVLYIPMAPAALKAVLAEPAVF
jgi:origin recognition complex subunit 2